MKWEEESKAMIGTFLHNFTNPAIEQLVRTGKEKIYRCGRYYKYKYFYENIFRAISPSPSPSGSREGSPEPEEILEQPAVKQRRLS